MSIDRPNERTYKSFKEFFDKVNQIKKLKLYSYSYVLLFSFFEIYGVSISIGPISPHEQKGKKTKNG